MIKVVLFLYLFVLGACKSRIFERLNAPPPSKLQLPRNEGIFAEKISQDRIAGSKNELENDTKPLGQFLNSLRADDKPRQKARIHAAIFAINSVDANLMLTNAVLVRKFISRKLNEKRVTKAAKAFNSSQIDILELFSRNQSELKRISEKSKPLLNSYLLGSARFLTIKKISRSKISSVMFYFNKYFPSKKKIPFFIRNFAEKRPGLVHWFSQRKKLLTFLSEYEWQNFLKNHNEILAAFLSIGVKEAAISAIKQLPKGRLVAELIIDLNNLALLINSKSPMIQASAAVQIGSSGINKLNAIRKLHQEWQLQVYIKYRTFLNAGENILEQVSFQQKSLSDLLAEAEQVKSDEAFLQWSKTHDNSFFAYVYSLD